MSSELAARAKLDGALIVAKEFFSPFRLFGFIFQPFCRQLAKFITDLLIYCAYVNLC